MLLGITLPEYITDTPTHVFPTQRKSLVVHGGQKL